MALEKATLFSTITGRSSTMKQKHYIVTFKNGRTVFASSFNEEEAKILAQAVLIKSGMTYEVENIKRTSNLSDMVDTDFVA